MNGETAVGSIAQFFHWLCGGSMSLLTDSPSLTSFGDAKVCIVIMDLLLSRYLGFIALKECFKIIFLVLNKDHFFHLSFH